MRGLVQLFGIKYFFSLQPVLAQKRALVCTYLLRRTINHQRAGNTWRTGIREEAVLLRNLHELQQHLSLTWFDFTWCNSLCSPLARSFLCKSIVQLSKWTFCSPRVLSYFIILMCGPTNVRRGREALHIKMLPPLAALEVHPLSAVDTGFQGGRYIVHLSEAEGARLQNLVWVLHFS